MMACGLAANQQSKQTNQTTVRPVSLEMCNGQESASLRPCMSLYVFLTITTYKLYNQLYNPACYIGSQALGCLKVDNGRCGVYDQYMLL